MLDVNRHIRGFHEDEPILLRLIHEREPTRIHAIVQANTRTRQQHQRALLHPSLCNRNRNHLLRPSTSVSASRLSTKPTAGSARPKLPVRPSYRPPRPTLA